MTPAFDPEMYDSPFWPTYQQNARSFSVASSIEAMPCTLMLLPSDSKSTPRLDRTEVTSQSDIYEVTAFIPEKCLLKNYGRFISIVMFIKS
jgi:hypothetical protein